MKLDSLHQETPLGANLFKAMGGKQFFSGIKGAKQHWKVTPRFYQQANAGDYGVEMKRIPRHDKYFGGVLAK